MASRNRQLLVVERGAVAPREVASEPELLVQMLGESPARFAQRVLERVAASRKVGERLSSIVLLTGPYHAPPTAGARRLIALALAAHAAALPGLQELRFEAQLEGDQRISAQLLSIADEVMSHTNGRVLPLRMTFNEKPPPSQEPESGSFWLSPVRRGRAS